jgi:hypothetical protein
MLTIVGPFDPEARCPKCGTGDAWASHAPADRGCGRPCHPELPERIIRRCDRCRYAWWETPLDATVV